METLRINPAEGVPRTQLFRPDHRTEPSSGFCAVAHAPSVGSRYELATAITSGQEEESTAQLRNRCGSVVVEEISTGVASPSDFVAVDRIGERWPVQKLPLWIRDFVELELAVGHDPHGSPFVITEASF